LLDLSLDLVERFDIPRDQSDAPARPGKLMGDGAANSG
jgi:hypothetical protein